MAKRGKGAEVRAALRATLPLLNMMAMSDSDPAYSALERRAIAALGLKSNPAVRGSLHRIAGKPVSILKASTAKRRKFKPPTRSHGQSHLEEKSK